MGHKFHSGFGLDWTNQMDTIMSLLEVNCVRVGGFQLQTVASLSAHM